MILVVGATGSLGYSVCRRLLQVGRRVRALVRDESAPRAQALRDAGVQTVVGDMKNAAQVDDAMRGCSVVVSTATATLSRRPGDSIEAVDGQGTQNLITAAEREKVKHFIFVSFSRNAGDAFPVARFKRAAERRLEQSQLPFTVLLPSYFPDVFLTPLVGFDVDRGTARIYGTGELPVSYITREDVASAVMASLDNPKALGQSLQMGGPRAISQLEMVRLVEQATHTKLALDFLSLDAIEQAMASTTDSLKQSHLGLYRGLAIGDDISLDWTKVLPFPLESMETWIARWAEGRAAR